MPLSSNLFKPRHVSNPRNGRADPPAPATSTTNAPTARRMFWRIQRSLTSKPSELQQPQQGSAPVRPDRSPSRPRSATPPQDAIFSFIPASFANQRTRYIGDKPVRATVIHYIAIEVPDTLGKGEYIYAAVPGLLLYPNENNRDFLNDHGTLKQHRVQKSVSIKRVAATPSAWNPRIRPRQNTNQCVWECIVTMRQTHLQIGEMQAEVRRIYVKHFTSESEANLDSDDYAQRPSSSRRAIS